MGGEQYLIIGNFDNDRQLPRRGFHGFDSLNGRWGLSYSSTYVFDDVELIPLNPKECSQAFIRQMVIRDTLNSIDTTFSLTDIHFATNSSEPLGECGNVLKIIQMLLINDSSLAVKVSGFTDLTGTRDSNEELSVKRAAAIGKQLSGLGIDCKRIYLVGYGTKFPVEGTKDESLVNRRVELNIAPKEKLVWAHARYLCN